MQLYNYPLPLECNQSDESDDSDNTVWDDDTESENETVEPHVIANDGNHQHALQLIKWITTFLLLWQTAFNVTSRAMASLLGFLGKLFQTLAQLSGSPLLLLIARLFPASLYRSQKILGLSEDSFTTFAVCTHCYSIYELSDCICTTSHPPKRCDSVTFPKHRQAYRRLSCNAPLFRRIMLSQDKFRYYQICSYPYKSLKDALQRLLLRPGLSEMLESWRNRKVPCGSLCDVYDGRIWTEFSDYFTQSRSLGMMLNLDWFQPFEHTTDSYGAIYLTVMNLPRKERFKKENVILVGVLPAMEHEPSQVNSFLHPLVQELKDLQTGVRLFTASSPRYKLTFHARLLCAACDIPAGRKLCGFKGHAAKLGCSRCLKVFPGEIGSKDYSGFDRDNWPKRNQESHREKAKSIKEATSKSQRNSLETSYGIKYSILLELDYFDPVRFNIIDPMHNLFLGTAKTMMKDIWLSTGIITHKQLDSIQLRVNKVIVPPNVGRIPSKIASSFAEFTAEQWKNWTIIYSLFALRDILPQAHYRCWESFVLACRLLCSTCISLEDIQKADLLLLKFCRKVEELYGQNAIKPNMHLHCHLQECVKDFGPIYGFWLFSYERYNGLLGNFPTNKKSVEIQLMRHFEKDQNLANLPLPDTFTSTLGPALRSLNKHKFFNSEEINTTDETFLVTTRNSPLCHIVWPQDTTQFCSFPKVSRIKMLSSEDRQHLISVYHQMYPALCFTSDDIPYSIVAYTSCFLGSEKLGCASGYRTRKHSYVLASPLSNSYVEIVPGQIEVIFIHRFQVGDQEFKKIFCEVSWYKEHDKRYDYGRALQIFSRDFSDKSIMPLPRVFSKFAPAFGSIHTNDDHVLFVCPIYRHFAI